MGRKFCVDKGLHYSKIMNNLHEMRKEGNLCDFTIKVGESRFQAHKNILSAGSEYFRAMFKHDTLETRRGEVELKDMDSECFESCLDFIYTAEFMLPDEKSSKLLYASQILQINEITLAVINDLESSLTVENFYKTRNIAVLFSLENLITKCHDFECRNFMAIISASDHHHEALIEANDNHKEKSTLVIFNKGADCLLTFDSNTSEVAKFHEVKFRHLGAFTAISLNSFIYVICANKSVYRLKSTDRNSEWERLPDMITDHGIYPPAVSALCSLFVIGNSTSCSITIGHYDEPLNVVERFDPITNQWIRLGDKPEPICLHSLVSLNNSIYCIGGYSENGSSFCKFNPMSQEWIDLEPMKNARKECGTVAIGYKIFVFGGGTDEGASNEVECFDITTSQWSALSPMPDGHLYVIAKHVKGWIYVVEPERQSDTMLKYDVRNDRWHKVEIKNIPSFEIYTIS